MDKKKSFFPKGKKGYNDVVILIITGGIFLTSLLFLPIIANGLGQSTLSAESAIDQTRSDVQNQAENVSSISAFRVLLSFLSLGFVNIGTTFALPVVLELFYSMVFYAFVLTIARNIWIGGGS